MFFKIFIKWRGGNKMTYRENCKNPEGGKGVDHPTRWCLVKIGWSDRQCST